MSFSQLKDLVPKAAGKFQLQGEMKAALVINRASALAKELFDEDVVRHIRVKRFKDGVLWLAVGNAAVAQEVLMKSLRLRTEVNASLAEELIKNVRTFQETEQEEPLG